VGYFWNVALCEALYPALDALEVSLRNSIHASATTAYATPFWFDQPGVLIRKHPGIVQAARDSLTYYRRPHTAGRIVAELNFGFWTGVMTGPYEQHFWKPNNYALLRATFPHIPYKIRTRKNIYDRYNAIRFLRNRVFHFEPILDDPALQTKHQEILETIGWVSPSLRDAVELFDRFPHVNQNERQQIESKLRAWLTP
jgi:hypothetical protein